MFKWINELLGVEPTHMVRLPNPPLVMGDPTKPAGIAALEALGLPTERCAMLQITFMPSNVLEVSATYHPTEAQMEDVTTVLRGHLLVRDQDETNG